MERFKDAHLRCPNCGSSTPAGFEGMVAVCVTLNGEDASVSDGAQFWAAEVIASEPMRCLECLYEGPAFSFIRSE